MHTSSLLWWHNVAVIKSAWWAWSRQRCHRRGDLELALERWIGTYQADNRACHTLKSECVIPGVHRKGNARFLLSSVIADSDHIRLFGSPNAQQAHRELKPLSFSHCLVTSTFIAHASESLLFIKKWKQALSSFIWSLLLAFGEAALSLLYSARELVCLHQFSLLSPSHNPF